MGAKLNPGGQCLRFMLIGWNVFVVVSCCAYTNLARAQLTSRERGAHGSSCMQGRAGLVSSAPGALVCLVFPNGFGSLARGALPPLPSF